MVNSEFHFELVLKKEKALVKTEAFSFSSKGFLRLDYIAVLFINS